MGYGFRIIIEGEYAAFNRPEMKVERVSYDVPTPSALEGLLKSIYWKPSIRYVIDQIIVFNPISFINFRRNEVKVKVSYQNMRALMNGQAKDPTVYTVGKNRNQRASLALKDVKYGVTFHFEPTGLRCDNDDSDEKKHYSIIKRRLENGQHFRAPCLGCAEFPVSKIEQVDSFDLSAIDPKVVEMGDVDLGYMVYTLNYQDGGVPPNGDWENPNYSDNAEAVYYRPHMVCGVIDVQKYRGRNVC